MPSSGAGEESRVEHTAPSLQVNEVGPRIAASIHEYFQEPRNRELVERLRQAKLTFTGKKRERGTQLQGKTFVLTGTLAHHTPRRPRHAGRRRGLRRRDARVRLVDVARCGRPQFFHRRLPPEG